MFSQSVCLSIERHFKLSEDVLNEHNRSNFTVEGVSGDITLVTTPSSTRTPQLFSSLSSYLISLAAGRIAMV